MEYEDMISAFNITSDLRLCLLQECWHHRQQVEPVGSCAVRCFIFLFLNDTLPALNTVLSSRLLTAASTASRAVPPFSRTENPSSAAIFTPSTVTLASWSGSDQAPPCTTTTAGIPRFSKRLLTGKYYLWGLPTQSHLIR